MQFSPNEKALPLTWNLKDYFPKPSGKFIPEELNSISKQIQEFTKNYRNKIVKLSARKILSLLSDYEDICERVESLDVYAYLNHSLKTNDPEAGRTVRSVQQSVSSLSEQLKFVVVEISSLGAGSITTLANKPNLTKYRHFLLCLAKSAQFSKSENEEIVFERKSLTSRQAFERLFTQINSSRIINFDGKAETQSETLTHLGNKDPEVRQKASEAFSEALGKDISTVTYVYNTLIQDKYLEDTYRGYSYPQQHRDLANELSPNIVDTLTSEVITSFPQIVQRYYDLKKKQLGLPVLHEYDRIAPVNTDEPIVNYSTSVEIVQNAFSQFSPVYEQQLNRIFSSNWIDVFPKPGKRSGAYCHAVTPSHGHPYIMLNHTNKLSSTLTLAHELGHGIHDLLSYNQGFFNYHPPLVLAESASTFGELLVFDYLLPLSDSSETNFLLSRLIEDSISTIHRQITLYQFEKSTHATYSELGELTSDQIGKLWLNHQKIMYGPSLDLTSSFNLWWSYIPHFFHTPFYVYSYAFGQLLSFSLFDLYKNDPERFKPKYIEFLSLGGSKSPQELISGFGFDLSDPNFWRSGLNVIQKYLVQLESAWNSKL